ncbi:MAG: 30S ribosomal protein S15 [Candidatus Thermoplasmatota archaeon]|nr:30S ribosomal protein S15 [Candidatus Thermoplasmatota archaeon]
MARMHTRKRGKSKSRKIYSSGKPNWIQFSNDEITKMIVDLKKAGNTSSMIGIKLRDQYGIPGTRVVLGKKVNQVLADAGIRDQVPEDLINLIRRYQSASRHIELNPKDFSNKRGQMLIMSKILRLVKYYKREGKLAPEWNLAKVL